MVTFTLNRLADCEYIGSVMSEAVGFVLIKRSELDPVHLFMKFSNTTYSNVVVPC